MSRGAEAASLGHRYPTHALEQLCRLRRDSITRDWRQNPRRAAEAAPGQPTPPSPDAGTSVMLVPAHQSPVSVLLEESLPPMLSASTRPPSAAAALLPCPRALLTQPRQEARPACWAEIRLATKGDVSSRHALPSRARLGHEPLRSPLVTTE